MSCSVAAVIQARTSSSRLPGKVLHEVTPQGESLLEVAIRRAKLASLVDEVVVATTDLEEDEPIEQICRSLGISCIRGSKNDVLGRYTVAANKLEAENVLRLTADDPFKNPEEMDAIIAWGLDRQLKYVANNFSLETPEGMDLEFFSTELLNRAASEARKSYEREHVTPWIRSKLGILGISTDFPSGYHYWPEVRLTIDVELDLEFTRAVYRLLQHGSSHSTAELLAVLLENPELPRLNLGAQERNAGLRMSMKQEKSLH